MIHSAVVRLTLFYLAIIAALSIGFSIAVYRTSSEEFGRSIPEPDSFRQLQPDYISDYEYTIQERAEEGRAHLRHNLIAFNIVTIALGSAVSYAFARRTLLPIHDAMEAQGRFTADASHELRTPLTAMQTEIEVGLRNPKLKLSDAKALLTSTLEEVGKLSALANGLLRLTKNNGADIPKKPVGIYDLAAEASARVEPARAAKRITITNNLDNKLEALGDEHSLHELLVILLDNAIKYSPEKTTVAISGRIHGRYIYIDVADQGYGMKASEIPHVFERFYRADTSRTKQRIDGYGLGLSIAKQIVAAHHGDIEVASRPGEGTTFTVKLPQASSKQEDSAGK